MTIKKTDTKTKVTKATKTTAKKVEKVVEKVDIKTLTVSQTELGYILGVSTPTISHLVQAQKFTPDDNGRLNLLKSVSAYCKGLRERKQGNSLNELQLENIALKNEKIKEQLRSWRMQRDRECGLAIIQALKTAMQRLKDEASVAPAIGVAIDGLIKAIDCIDIDNISYLVEGEEVEEDEE